MTCTIMVKKMTNMYKYYSNSGTESFDVIFKSDFFKNGDEVIVPVSLCECVIDSIIKNSLVPVFVDIDKNFLIKKEDIKKKITNKTRAIIFVEQYGFDINNVCTYNLIVIIIFDINIIVFIIICTIKNIIHFSGD